MKNPTSTTIDKRHDLFYLNTVNLDFGIKRLVVKPGYMMNHVSMTRFLVDVSLAFTPLFSKP
ncbi:MAG TPA: hypothetical protein VLK78_09330 [Candidatus Angelobacter sp.]|nr:hypothetical protein [Candidatus Angelobacter sp.]